MSPMKMENDKKEAREIPGLWVYGVYFKEMLSAMEMTVSAAKLIGAVMV